MEVANVVGTRGAKWGAVRLGCGIAGATLMAVALPVSTGWGAIGSPSPKPAEAAAICSVNRAFANGSGRSGPAGVDETSYGPDTRRTVVRIQRDAGIASDGVYGPQTAEAMRWSFSDSHGQRSCETLSGTRLIALR
jgi:peptidoglycan hydrolase-like protein with peptidoglycan-binding domain